MPDHGEAALTEQHGVMQLEVIAAESRHEPVVRRLLELYQHDFSEFDDNDVDDHGEYGYDRLPDYWTDPARHPLLFRVDGRWAGFALVRLGAPNDMAEFFVMRKYRRHGIGLAAARAVFARFPGAWQVRQLETNPAATAFWRRAIPAPFEQDHFEHGPRQRFTMPEVDADV